MTKEKKIIIAVDGPAGAGKSTVAKEIANELNYTYLDTGAMYRAITLKASKEQLNIHSEEEIAEMIKDTVITITNGQVFLDNIDVTNELRSDEIEKSVSIISRYKAIREFLVEQQRNIGKAKGIVVDGRDIGTHVFPQAELKIYLAATLPIRIKRRYLQQMIKSPQKAIADVEIDITHRDKIDMGREIGPLKPAADAVYLDTSNLTAGEVVKNIVTIARVIITNENN